MISFADKINTLGKPNWQGLLQYTAELHYKSIQPAIAPFPHDWEEIGPGYCYAPAFGHWDIIHAILDILPYDQKHALKQMENNLSLQRQDGFLPGSVWINEGKTSWDQDMSHPPLWPFAIQEIANEYDKSIISKVYPVLCKQIQWFENNRKTESPGFYYKDILNHQWESGIDEGIRFLDVKTGPLACIDASSHMYALYDFAKHWAEELGHDSSEYQKKATELKTFLQKSLYVEETGFFHDIWAVENKSLRCHAFEGMWPMVVGGASHEQAERVINENLLNPDIFFTEHPLATISVNDPHFELRMWRGPAWNSMTYWAAKGCLRYDHKNAAKMLLERALDCSARQFDRTGTIWEFYHPHGGKPEDVQRKPAPKHNMPCHDYLGHNPFLAMAKLWEEACEKK